MHEILSYIHVMLHMVFFLNGVLYKKYFPNDPEQAKGREIYFLTPTEKNNS